MGSIGTNGVDKSEEQRVVGDDWEDDYEITKDDIESAYRAIALSGTHVPIDEITARIEKDAAHAGIKLAADWKTKFEEEDLPEWVK